MAVNINEIKNPKLKTFIDMLKIEDTTDNRNSVINEVVAGNFIVPVMFSPTPDMEEVKKTGKLPEGTKMNICIMMNEKGDKFIPAFTDVDEVKKWRQLEYKKQGLSEEEIDQRVKNEPVQCSVFIFPQFINVIFDKNKPLDGMVINPCGNVLVLNSGLLKKVAEIQLKNYREQNPEK